MSETISPEPRHMKQYIAKAKILEVISNQPEQICTEIICSREKIFRAISNKSKTIQKQYRARAKIAEMVHIVEK